MPDKPGGRLKGKARKEAKAAQAAATQPAVEIQPTPAAMALRPRCGVCSKPDSLFPCPRCKVMQYCSQNHRTSHWKSHEAACNKVKKAQLECAKEEDKLRNHPGDFMMPPNPFENSVGHFWGLLDTRPYMRQCFGVIEALLGIKTFEAVQTAYDNAREILRLNRSDNMGVRDVIPSLLIRLGRDQDAYDFLKWYLTTGERSDYDWGDPDLPFLDVVNADIFESVDLACERFTSLSNQVDITLLKIRLLLDIQDLQALNVSTIDLMKESKLPQELIDRVKNFVPRNRIISENKDLMKATDHSSLVEKLEDQVGEIFAAAMDTNSYFWPALLNPGNHLTARPDFTSAGSIQEMQVVLQYTYDAWNETPGAIEMARSLLAKQMDGRNESTF